MPQSPLPTASTTTHYHSQSADAWRDYLAATTAAGDCG
jgi:hypothetical protein